jgi:hypothetical protein
MKVYKEGNSWYVDYPDLDGNKKKEVVTVDGKDPSKINRADAERFLEVKKFLIAQEKGMQKLSQKKPKKSEKPRKVEKVEKSSALVEKREEPHKTEKFRKSEKSDFLVTRTFKIKKIWDDKLDQICYWERKQKQIVLDRILEKALKNLKYDDVPDEEQL